jgi:methylase of polypeptide subunit release factors
MVAESESLASVPLLSAAELAQATPALRSLYGALDACDYARVGQLPTGRNPLVLPREPLTLFHALRGRRTQIFLTSAVPALYRRLLTPEAARLAPFLYGGQARSRAELDPILGRECVDALCERRVLVPVGERLVSLLRVTPLSGGYLVSDRANHRRSGQEPVWLGADSLSLCEWLRSDLPGRRYEAALDLCCGSGVQAFAVAPHADAVTGADLNPRAVAMATLNAQLRSQVEVDFVCADLADALTKREYDLVVSNPPFVAMPEERREGFMDGYGGPLGLEIVDRILELLPACLRPNGRAYLRMTSPIVAGEDQAVPRLRRLVDEHGCSVRMAPLSYLLEPEFAEHQVASGIERLVAQIVRIDRDGGASFARERMPRVRAWVTAAQVRRLRRAAQARLDA